MTEQSGETTRPGGAYRPSVITEGPQLHLAGQTARRGEEMVAVGRVGGEIGIDVARECAAQCVRNLLAHAREALGTGYAIAAVVRVNVYVAAEADFADHSAVADGASNTFREELGEIGQHVRSAIGVNSLPRNSPVEVDATLQLTER